MFAAAPYIVAIGSLLFCAASALTLINVVEHFDPPDVKRMPTAADFQPAASARERVAV